jgi:hypothetical protein
LGTSRFIIFEGAEHMKRHWIAITIALASFVALVPARALAQTVKFEANLDGGQSVPPIITGASGRIEMTGNVQTASLSWKVKLVNLPTGLLSIDLHVGGPGIVGPEVFSLDVPLFVSNEVEFEGSKPITSAVLQPHLGIRSLQDFVESLVGGVYYVVVHTQLNPNGDIRGQLTRLR